MYSWTISITLIIVFGMYAYIFLNAMEEVKDREREQRSEKARVQARVQAQALHAALRRTPEEKVRWDAEQRQLEEARLISEEKFRQKCEKEKQERARLMAIEEARRAEARKANYRRLNEIMNMVVTSTLRVVDIVLANTVIRVRRACDFVDTKVRERGQRKRDM